MSMIRNLLYAGVLASASFAVAPAYALTAKECSVKYQAAKEAGTLGDLKWNDFRKAECASDDSPAASTKATATKPKTTAAANDDDGGGLSMKECSAKYQAAKSAGTLGGMKWNDFRKAQCAAGTAAAPVTKTKTAKSQANDNDDAGGGLTMKECSAKYQAAKSAGTLGGMKWNDFRKAQCAAGASTTAATADNDDDNSGGGLTMKECSAKYQAAKSAGTLGGLKWNDFRKAQCSASATAANDDDDSAPTVDNATYTDDPPAPTSGAPRGVAFPSAVATKYSTESPGKARMHTCLDQYYANKQRNSLGGLKWIQKGGGYYSLCNSRLKS
ncbi:hypothetical protein [Phyllobacterium sp. 21LDTY02-6]|uniref:hypothetical protein n=1 Tax=Phyllobacterium sp. 21LDTY02-6 TaxID=2944903 RepID=UPI003531C99C